VSVEWAAEGSITLCQSSLGSVALCQSSLGSVGAGGSGGLRGGGGGGKKEADTKLVGNSTAGSCDSISKFL